MGDDKDKDKPGGQPQAAPPAPKAPQIPKDTPADLRDFIDCKAATVTLKSGKLKWLPLPDTLKKLAPDPELTLEPGAQPGTVDIKVGIGFVSLTLPASVTDGQLNIDTSSIPEDIPGKEQLDEWVKDLNSWFKSKGKKFGKPTIKRGAVTLTKEAIGAGQPGGTQPPEPPKPKDAPGGVKAGPGVGMPADDFGGPLIGVAGRGASFAPVGLGALVQRYLWLVLLLVVLLGGFVLYTGGPGGASPSPAPKTPGPTSPPVVTASAGVSGASCTGPQFYVDQFYPDGVKGGNGAPPTFDTGGKRVCLTHLATYHWNDGAGAPAGGTLSIVDATGAAVGSWPAMATEATGGVLANWEASIATDPPIILDGTYSVNDSGAGTWSWSDLSGGKGFIRVWGVEYVEP